MALPCLGYLFETDFLCMCCTSCLYPLIRDRCGALGSHQESKKLHPLSILCLPCSLLFPAKMLHHMAPASMRVAPVRATLHTVAKEQRRERKRRAKASVASNHTEKQERRHGRGGLYSIKARVRGKGDIKARWGSLS